MSKAKIVCGKDNPLTVSDEYGTVYKWMAQDGDICKILSYNHMTGLYRLEHPLHPTEPFIASEGWVVIVNIEETPPAGGRPSSCSCSMNQLWKTGCICGHWERHKARF